MTDQYFPLVVTRYREMRCTLPEGVVTLRWPEPISVESVETIKEIIALQLGNVERRAESSRSITRQHAASAAQCAPEPPKTETP